MGVDKEWSYLFYPSDSCVPLVRSLSAKRLQEMEQVKIEYPGTDQFRLVGQSHRFNSH
jgi:hypothetical protein